MKTTLQTKTEAWGVMDMNECQQLTFCFVSCKLSSSEESNNLTDLTE